MKPEELIERAEKVLESEGTVLEKKSDAETLSEYILPAMSASKDILSTIYAFASRKREGFLGKIKTKVQQKIVLTVVNVIEKQSMRQQKFNELTYKAIEKLTAENQSLRLELESIKKGQKFN